MVNQTSRRQSMTEMVRGLALRALTHVKHSFDLRKTGTTSCERGRSAIAACRFDADQRAPVGTGLFWMSRDEASVTHWFRTSPCFQGDEQCKSQCKSRFATCPHSAAATAPFPPSACSGNAFRRMVASEVADRLGQRVGVAGPCRRSATMMVVTPAILDALADGVTAITPNRRLARQLSRDFDRMQQALGRRSWPTPSVLPYATWLESLWERRGDPGSDGGIATLLTSAQSSHLVAQDRRPGRRGTARCRRRRPPQRRRMDAGARLGRRGRKLACVATRR